MIGIDTNLLVRLLTADDPEQTLVARRAVGEAVRTGRVFVSLIVVVEAAWVLRKSYRFALEDVLTAFEELLVNLDFRFEEEHVVRDALSAARGTNVDFADCLIARRNRAFGCETTLTFDRRAARLADFTLLTAP